MNRFKLHILTLLAIAVASCESVNKSIDTFYLDNLQYFDVAIGCDYASKSTIVTSDNQPVTFTKFGAYAVDLSNRELFMDNARIDYNKNTTQWVSANPVTEWPSDGALFYGYAPYANGNVRSSIDSDGNMVISFNNEILARDQIDLMISNPKSKSTAGSVGLTFNHCLSAIAFRFSGDGSIKVKSVGFKGVYGSGDITATASGERSWSNLVFNDDSSYRIKLSNNNLPLTGVDALTSTNGDYLMMIPTDKEVFKNMDIVVELEDTTTKAENIVVFDMPTDLSWEANNIYTYAMDLEDMNVINFEVEVNSWIDADNSGESVINPELGALELSNCYMYNSNLSDRELYIPIDERIKEFYEDYLGYKNEQLRKYTLEIGDQWTPKVIWSYGDDKFKSVIDNFKYEPLTPDEMICVARNDRVTADCMPNYLTTGCKAALRITVPEEAKEGSILIGIYVNIDDVETLIWSWHIWITEYDPNTSTPTATSNESVYDVPGGEVHRYSDDENQSPAIWSAGGLYANSYIMDRNIGARGINRTYGEDEDTFYYQFGRKDPIIASTSASTMSGSYNLGVAKGMLTSVQNPTLLWINTFSNGTPSWNEDDASFDEEATWNDVNARHDLNVNRYVVQKSIFDPSPLGWKIPVKDVWNAFPESFTNTSIFEVTMDNIGTTPTFDISVNLWDFKDYDDGMLFTYDGFVHFPESGFEAGYENAGTGGYQDGYSVSTNYYFASSLWSCTNGGNYTIYNSGSKTYRDVPSTGYCYRMIGTNYTASVYKSGGVVTSRRNGAMPIRCIQEQR